MKKLLLFALTFGIFSIQAKKPLSDLEKIKKLNNIMLFLYSDFSEPISEPIPEPIKVLKNIIQLQENYQKLFTAECRTIRSDARQNYQTLEKDFYSIVKTGRLPH